MFLSKFRVEWLVYRLGDSVSTLLPDAGLCADRWVIADKASIHNFFSSEYSRRRRFQQFLRSGCLGLFLIRGDQWIAYAWSAQPGNKGHPPHLPRRTIPVDAYWIFYCHTRKDFRGQGIFKQVLAKLISLIYTRSSDARIYVDVLPDNVPSNRAIARSGFEPSGVIVTYKLWAPYWGGHVLSGKWLQEQPHSQLYRAQKPVIRP